MSAIIPLLLVGIIIFIGFIGNLLFKKTNIPDIIWLLFLGLIIGPYAKLVDPTMFIAVVEIFAALALIIILFDGGINMDLYKLLRDAPRGVLLMLISFTLTIIVTTVVVLALGHTFLEGILLGAIIGGTSSPIVIPIITKLGGVSEKTKIILQIESALTDVLCIVVAIAVMGLIATGGADIGGAAATLASAFSVGIMLGILIGLVWIPVMHRLQNIEFSYVITLGLLFLIYAGVETLGGSGAIACLFFGVVLGNGRKVFSMMRYSGRTFQIDATTRKFHSLITFFVRTFFFVYLGLVVTIGDITYLMIGVLLTAALLLIRPIAVMISTRGDESITPRDRRIMYVMLPRGLAAAVLAYLPISMGLPGSETGFISAFPDIIFTVILGTVIVATIGTLVMGVAHKKQEKKQKAEEEQKQVSIKKPKILESPTSKAKKKKK